MTPRQYALGIAAAGLAGVVLLDGPFLGIAIICGALIWDRLNAPKS